MNNKIQNAFEPICATDKLKDNLTAFVKNEVSKHRHTFSAPLRYAIACCAILAIAVCGFGGYKLYQMPVSYISVDVNPSVELALNRFDRVVNAEFYNDDGFTVLQNINVKNKTYTEAVELILADKTFNSYLSKDSLLSFTVISDKEDAILKGIQHCKGYSQANTKCYGANAELMDEAHHNGLSFGKYQALLELQQYDKTITAEDCHNLTMREIRDCINDYVTDSSNANAADNSSNRQYNGNGHHGNENRHHAKRR
ncbi:MAG: hypothetical protein RR654_08385 [Oscillospiraceae bacterium]